MNLDIIIPMPISIGNMEITDLKPIIAFNIVWYSTSIIIMIIGFIKRDKGYGLFNQIHNDIFCFGFMMSIILLLIEFYIGLIFLVMSLL